MKSKSAFLVCLVVCLFLTEFSSFLLIMPAEATGANWLAGWSYRKSHVINNATGAGTNYQVQIITQYGSGSDSGNTVYLNNHLGRADFGDIRITDVSNRLQDAWNQTQNNGLNCTVWVNIGADLSTEAQCIFIYYGNTALAPYWNGTATFPVFDSMENFPTGPPAWTNVNMTISSSQSHDGTYSANSNSNNTNGARSSLTRLGDTGIMCWFRLESLPINNVSQVLSFGQSSSYCMSSGGVKNSGGTYYWTISYRII